MDDRKGRGFPEPGRPRSPRPTGSTSRSRARPRGAPPRVPVRDRRRTPRAPRARPSCRRSPHPRGPLDPSWDLPSGGSNAGGDPKRPCSCGLGGATSPGEMDPRVGTEFAGHRIERVVGRGGASVVYLAEHLRLGRKVALKVLAPHLADDEAFRERFIRESRIAAGLDHPNIVTVYDAGEDERQPLHLDALRGGARPRQLLEAEGPLGPRSRSSRSCPRSRAPSTPRTPRGSCIATSSRRTSWSRRRRRRGSTGPTSPTSGSRSATTSREGLTRTGQFVGTVDYVAPEQITGEPVDGRTDVYSLGCVLFECLCGRVPFAGETGVATIYSHLHDRPPSLEGFEEHGKKLDRVIARALAKSRESRFETCGALMEAVRTELTAPVPATPPAGTGSVAGERRAGAHRPPSGGGWLRRHAAVAFASLAAIAAVAVALVLVLPEDGSNVGRPSGPTGGSGASPEATGSTGPTGSPDPPPRFVWTPAYAPERSGLRGGAIIDAVVLDDAVVAVGHTLARRIDPGSGRRRGLAVRRRTAMASDRAAFARAGGRPTDDHHRRLRWAAGRRRLERLRCRRLDLDGFRRHLDPLRGALAGRHRAPADPRHRRGRGGARRRRVERPPAAAGRGGLGLARRARMGSRG